MIAAAPPPPMPVPTGRSAAASSLVDSPPQPSKGFARLLDRDPIAAAEARIGPVLARADQAGGSGDMEEDATYSFAASSLFNTEATSAALSDNVHPPLLPIGALPQDVPAATSPYRHTVGKIGGPSLAVSTAGAMSAISSSRPTAREHSIPPVGTPAGLAAGDAFSRQLPTGQAARRTSASGSTLAAALQRAAFAIPSVGSVHVTVTAGAHGVIVTSRLATADSDDIGHFAQACLDLAEELGCPIEMLSINGRLRGPHVAGGR